MSCSSVQQSLLREFQSYTKKLFSSLRSPSEKVSVFYIVYQKRGFSQEKPPIFLPQIEKGRTALIHLKNGSQNLLKICFAWEKYHYKTERTLFPGQETVFEYFSSAEPLRNTLVSMESVARNPRRTSFSQSFFFAFKKEYIFLLSLPSCQQIYISLNGDPLFVPFTERNLEGILLFLEKQTSFEESASRLRLVIQS